MARIIGTGMYVPKTIVKNSDISDSDSWIVENIGIKERRIAGNNTGSYELGRIAARNAIKEAKINAKDIDMIIVATATPNMIAPSTACMIAADLKVNCPAFDLNAVCAGFIYSLSLAYSYIDSGAKIILIIGVDTFSKITNWNDRDCVFFGDGAGAVVIDAGKGFLSLHIASHPYDNGFHCEKDGTFRMDKSDVYRFATDLVPEAIKEALRKANLTIDDIDYMVPHQPSKRILLDIADEIGLPREKVLMNMDKYANTSAGTIPILLHESWSKFKKGDKILFAAIGSGWTYGAAIYEV